MYKFLLFVVYLKNRIKRCMKYAKIKYLSLFFALINGIINVETMKGVMIMIKLMNYTLPSGIALKMHMQNTKDGMIGIVNYKKRNINTISEEHLTLKEEDLVDGNNIDCVIGDNYQLLKSDTGEVIYDFHVDRTIFKDESILDIINDTDKRLVKFYFEDVLICQAKESPKTDDMFKNRNSFKGVLHSNGDLMIVRFTPLHEHSMYSIDDAINHVSAIAKKTEYYSALSDHGNMYATLKFNDAMKKLDKKPIFAFEGYIEDLDDDIILRQPRELNTDEEIKEYKQKHCNGRHILFIAKNMTGFHNLIKLTSAGHDFFYNKPHIRYDVLEKYSEGVICTSACMGGSLPKAIMKHDKKKVDEFIQEMIRIFGKDDFYLEIQRHETLEMLKPRMKGVPLSLDDMKKMNISYVTEEFLGEDLINEIIKNDTTGEYSTKEDFFEKMIKTYKNYVKTRWKFSVNSYIDFLCSLSPVIEKNKEKILKKFDFDITSDYNYEVDKKLVSDVKFYLEESEINNTILELSKEYGLKIVATTDAHYTNEEDLEIHELWLCRQNAKTNINSSWRRKYPGERYHIQTSDEMVSLFADIPEALDNTLEIAEKCNVSLDNDEYFLPKFPLPKGFKDEITYFKYLCRKGYDERFKGTDIYDSAEYRERLKFEIDTIERMGFPGYFLIVQDFIKWAQDDHVTDHVETYFPSTHYNLEEIPEFYKTKDFKIYIGPGRGSAAGSLVSYCLGITQVNPIQFDLLFERFLNPSRISMPDIDIDIDEELRNHVFNYTRVKYGEKNTSRIITFNTATPKNAVGIAQRLLDMDLSLKDEISETIPTAPKTSFKSTFKESVEFNELYKGNDKAKKCIDYAMKFEDFIVTTGQHACGFLITPTAVTDYVPQIYLKDTEGIPQLTTQWDKDECESMGVLKMDFLGLRTLSIIRHSLDQINEIRKSKGQNEIEIYDIPIFDKNIYKCISTGDTSGMFQIESPGMQDLMKRLYKDADSKNFNGAEGFDRLSAALALYRPGPMDEIDNYIKNMETGDVYYEDPRLEKRLKDTYGIIVYQEQAMLICRDLAGFSEGQADKVRKGMAKKIDSILREYREYFIYGSVDHNIKGCINNGISEESAISIWEKMEKFGRYAFNKSHSVAYAFVTAYSAWITNYYPVIYMAAVLTSFTGNKDKLQHYLNVAKNRKIELLQPDINLSGAHFTAEDDKIRIGLMGISGIGKTTAKIIAEREKNGMFKSYYDLIYRMMKAGAPLNKGNLEALIYSGALDSLEYNRQTKVEAIEMLSNLLSLFKPHYASGQMTLLDYIENNPRTKNLAIRDTYEKFKDIKLEKQKEMPKQKMLSLEKKHAGFYITEHPLDEYNAILDKELKITHIQEFLPEIIEDEYGNTEVRFSEKALRKHKVKIAGILSNVMTFYTKKDNKPLSVFTIEDSTGSVDAVIFDDNRKNYLDLIKDDSILIIEGVLQVRNEKTQMVVNSMMPIEEAQRSRGVERIVIRSEDDYKTFAKKFNQLMKILTAHKAPKGERGVTICLQNKKLYKNESGTKELSIRCKWSQQLQMEIQELFVDVSQESQRKRF